MEAIGWMILVYVVIALGAIGGYCLGFSAGRRERRSNLDTTDLAIHAEADRGEWLNDLDRARARKAGRAE